MFRLVGHAGAAFRGPVQRINLANDARDGRSREARGWGKRAKGGLYIWSELAYVL